jgi:hypothetical protein
MGNRATGPIVDWLQSVVLAVLLECCLPVLQEVAMPAAVAAVSGHAQAGSSWLNLGERLGFGADDQLAAAWPNRSVQELEGRSATE